MRQQLLAMLVILAICALGGQAVPPTNSLVMVGREGQHFRLGERIADLQARLGPGTPVQFGLGRHDSGGAMVYGGVWVHLGSYYWNGQQREAPTGYVEGFFGGDLQLDGRWLREGDTRAAVRASFPGWKEKDPHWDVIRDAPYVGVEYDENGLVKEINVYR